MIIETEMLEGCYYDMTSNMAQHSYSKLQQT